MFGKNTTQYVRPAEGDYHEQSQKFIKNAQKQGAGVNVIDGELRKVVDTHVIHSNARRDAYEKAMNKAQRSGGSNGIGVGY